MGKMRECPFCGFVFGSHLKAQEPRVMTLEEAKAAYVVEYRSGRMNEIGAAINTLDVDPNNVYYGDIYRVWTSRPTEEQRKAVKWDGQAE